MPFSTSTPPANGVLAQEPANTVVCVRLDEAGGHVVSAEAADDAAGRHFLWADIRRVCFQCGGLYQSDLIVLQLEGDATPITVPLAAAGSPALLGQLVGRRLLPNDLLQRALGNADGGLYCWPEQA